MKLKSILSIGLMMAVCPSWALDFGRIPENEISKLFDAFYRIEQSRNRQTGGSGLGLYIVKTILDEHNALYGIKNTEKGVLFYIKFILSTY